jgi:uncharacterized protein (TIGR02186 family)
MKSKNLKKLTLGTILMQGILSYNVFAGTLNISKDKVLIGVDFKGDNILIFGQKEKKYDVVIIFKSQKVSYKIYGKQKIFGVWQNTDPRIFKDVYNTYFAFFEKDFQISRNDTTIDLEIGIQNIDFYNFSGSKTLFSQKDYKTAFLEKKIQKEIFSESQLIRSNKKENIFFNEVKIPANIKPGNYLLEVFFLKENELQELTVFPIQVEQVGFLSKIKEISKQNKVFYAGISILISIIIAFFAFILTKMLYYNRIEK